MRKALLFSTLLAGATAAVAQPAPRPLENVTGVPPQLADPRTADKLTDVMQSLSKALLELRVGDVQAALEGRAPTAADHRRTVASETGMTDSELRARIAAAKPAMEQSIRALNQALPAVLGGLQQAQDALDRATANMPDPNYPRR
jgi:hypothetical protein